MRSSLRASCAQAVVAVAGMLATGAAHAAADPQLCVACHGPNGNSTNPAMPSLAGQPAQFIGTQLVMFREKRRVDPQMSPIAATLTNADINALGKFFASQEHAAPTAKASAEVIERGRQITEKF